MKPNEWDKKGFVKCFTLKLSNSNGYFQNKGYS